MDQPRGGGLPFLSRAAAARGVRQTRSRLVDDVRIAERGRDIGLHHPADAAAAGMEQLGDTLLQAAAGEQRAGGQLAPGGGCGDGLAQKVPCGSSQRVSSEDSGSVSMSIPASASAGLR